MNRTQLVKNLAEAATQPLGRFSAPAERQVQAASSVRQELFVWFEDTSARPVQGRRGIAGLPESLLPLTAGARVRDRRYVEGHMHLLAAARIECRENPADLFASLYTVALSVGTVAWIGTGEKYARTWSEMYGVEQLPALPAPR